LSLSDKAGIARNLLRTAILEQLERSIGVRAHREILGVTAEEILNAVTRPSLAPALQVLSCVHAGDPAARSE
jgi:hypothetical protein